MARRPTHHHTQPGSVDAWPFSYPIGWFRVASNTQVSVGRKHTVRYFGRDLVIVRATSGKLTIFDSLCPHPGDHLGLARGQSEHLKFTFRGWQFVTSGSCVHIPRDNRIPSKASIDTCPVHEVNDQIMVWHHPTGKPRDHHLIIDPGGITQSHGHQISHFSPVQREGTHTPCLTLTRRTGHPGRRRSIHNAGFKRASVLRDRHSPTNLLIYRSNARPHQLSCSSLL
ncbi:hypothetical protein CFN78_16590 [Amycolatopsis antarctica]|uniref:Rieske domain-containing protein n=1 Tax=Amycolatopsis antarctica TaxID=1854586 RepID=A0A263D146_9PSEU|nr:hypothetical protein CFN78_16590 [Amycolatopsis antarctica]